MTFGMAKLVWNSFRADSEIPLHIWYKVPDCGTRTCMDRELWSLFPMGLWLDAVISYSFWRVAWVAALVSSRLLGTREREQ